MFSYNLLSYIFLQDISVLLLNFIEFFVFLLWSSESLSYIMVTSHLSAIWPAIISCQSMDYIFILLTLFFKQQKEVLDFGKSKLISFLLKILLSVLSLPKSKSSKCSPIFSFRSFIILGFIFKSKINFELIFIWYKVSSYASKLFYFSL